MFISKEALEIVKFSSPDSTRMGLYGVYTDAENHVATDGHRQMVLERKTEYGPQGKDINEWYGLFRVSEDDKKVDIHGVLNRASIEALLKAWPKVKKSDKRDRHNWAWINHHEARVLDANDQVMRFPIQWNLDAKFPNYKQVVPHAQDRPFEIGLNARYLADGAYLADGRSKMLHIHMVDGDNSALITGQNEAGQKGQYIVMPMRV